MIKAKGNKNGCDIQVEGRQSDIMAELTAIIRALLEEETINEQMLDIVVGLAKAEVNGTRNEYMKKTLKDVICQGLEKVLEEADKEEIEEEDDEEEDIDDVLKEIKAMLEKALEDED